MNDVTDLYKEEASVPKDLGALTKLCDEMVAVDAEVANLEQQLSDRKKVLQEYRVGKIPGLMQELGVADLTLTSGAKIILKRIISCRLNQAQKVDAFEWLEQREFGAMIKREVAVNFGRNEEGIANKAMMALSALGLQPSMNKDVHFQTLSAWARRQVEAGGEVPATLFDLSILNVAQVK